MAGLFSFKGTPFVIEGNSIRIQVNKIEQLDITKNAQVFKSAVIDQLLIEGDNQPSIDMTDDILSIVWLQVRNFTDVLNIVRVFKWLKSGVDGVLGTDTIALVSDAYMQTIEIVRFAEVMPITTTTDEIVLKVNKISGFTVDQQSSLMKLAFEQELGIVITSTDTWIEFRDGGDSAYQIAFKYDVLGTDIAKRMLVTEKLVKIISLLKRGIVSHARVAEDVINTIGAA